MSAPTVQAIFDWVNSVAPFETAEDFDNAGLLLGRADAQVKTVLCALDVTMEVVDEARALGANLILSHHPLMFHPLKNLREDTPENNVICELVRAQIALISAHTNLDKTALSGSACAARALGLKNIRQQGYLFIGETADDTENAETLAQAVKKTLRAPLRVYGDARAPVHTLAIAGGAYGEGYMEALNAGAQVYLTGEIRHHEALDAVARGLTLFEGGHCATERILVQPLAQCLQNAMNALKYKVRVCPSTSVSYPGALE